MATIRRDLLGQFHTETLPLSDVKIDYVMHVTKREGWRRRIHVYLLNVDVEKFYDLLRHGDLLSTHPPPGLWGYAKLDVCKVENGDSSYFEESFELVFERASTKNLITELDAWLRNLQLSGANFMKFYGDIKRG